MSKRLDVEKLTESLKLLENDASALGWDNPARIYGIQGDLDDPDLVFVAEIDGHPEEYLTNLYEQGMRPPVEAHGLALLVEAYRTIDLKEADALGLVSLEDLQKEHAEDWDEFYPFAGRKWAETLIAISPTGSIADLPEQLRKECRNIIAVLRDGRVLVLNHDRDGEIRGGVDNGMLGQHGGSVPRVLAALLEPLVLSPDSRYAVMEKFEDGSWGEELAAFPTEFDARRHIISLPGHSEGKYGIREQSVMEQP